MSGKMQKKLLTFVASNMEDNWTKSFDIWLMKFLFLKV